MIDLEAIANRHEHLMLYAPGDTTVEGDLVSVMEELRKVRVALAEIRRSSEYPYSGEVDHALWSIGMERQ